MKKSKVPNFKLITMSFWICPFLFLFLLLPNFNIYNYNCDLH